MALTFSRHPFSGSTDGRPIEVAAIGSLGTIIHVVQSVATDAREEIHLYANNRATATSVLTIELGGTATTDHIMAHLPAQSGFFLIVPGISFTATTSIIRAFTTGTATDKITIAGWVNRAT